MSVYFSYKYNCGMDNSLIGASLGESHTSELNNEFFMQVLLLYICHTYSVCLEFNATVHHVWSISNIFALTFQNEHSFPMGEDSEDLERCLGGVAEA